LGNILEKNLCLLIHAENQARLPRGKIQMNLSEGNLQAWEKSGIDRLSLGIRALMSGSLNL